MRAPSQEIYWTNPSPSSPMMESGISVASLQRDETSSLVPTPVPIPGCQADIIDPSWIRNLSSATGYFGNQYSTADTASPLPSTSVQQQALDPSTRRPSTGRDRRLLETDIGWFVMASRPSRRLFGLSSSVRGCDHRVKHVVALAEYLVPDTNSIVRSFPPSEQAESGCQLFGHWSCPGRSRRGDGFNVM